MEYSNIHRSFLQTVAGCGFLEQDKATEIFGKIWNQNTTEAQEEDSMEKTISLINKKIQDFDQRIVEYHYPLNEKKYYVFITTASTSVNKFQNVYNENELNFLRVVINEMVESPEFQMSPMEIINLTSRLPGKGITKQRAQQLLDRFIMNGYFFKDEIKIYYGPKMITEFREYLLTQFPDKIKVCTLCKAIEIWGIECEHCQQSFHKTCIKKYLTKAVKCPECNKPWKTVVD